MKRKLALGLAAVTLLSLGGGGYAYAKTPVAYVSVDINPSVELGVNAFDKVVSVEAYNEDGQKILEGTALVNSSVDEAVKTVISNAISDGYIKEDDAATTDIVDTTATTSAAVEITTATDKEDVADKLNESLKETADETLDNNNVDAEVETENVALARRDEARQLGITPGKLNLIQKLQALDPTIKVEDYKSSSVKDIQKKVKELRKSNAGDETTTDSNTNTDVNTGTSTDTNSDVNINEETNVVTEDNTKDAALSQESTSSEENTAVESNKNNKSSNENKDNKGINRKDDEDNDKQKSSDSTVNSQNNNSSKSEKNGNLNTQDKGNSKDKGKNN